MAVTNLLMTIDIPGLGKATMTTTVICVLTHLALFSSRKTQSKIVYFFSHVAFFLIILIFSSNLLYISKFGAANINDLFYFHSGRILQCVMFLIGAFRGNKEILDLCRSYSKDTKIMQKLNFWNSFIFVLFGWAFSFIYYMEYLKGSRFDFITLNALFIYKETPQYYSWSLIIYIFCLMQMLNDNIQHTLHFVDNLFSTKVMQMRIEIGRAHV